MVFNPNLESAPAPEQPVYSNVNLGAEGGMATVAGNALEMLGGLFAQAGERRQVQQGQRIRQGFLDNLETVRGLVNEGSIAQAQIVAGQAVSNYVGAGGQFDSDTRAAAVAISGLPEDIFGVSPEGIAAEAQMQRMATLMQDDTFQAYTAIERQANPTLSDDEIFGLAEARYNQANADAQLLVEAQTTGQLNFEAEGRAAINRRLDDFTQGSLGSLVDSISAGNPVDPNALRTVRVNFNQLQSFINGTLVNVSDDQRQEVTSRFENITNMMDNIEEMLTIEGQQARLEGYVGQLIAAGDLTDYTPTEILGAVLASNDLSQFIMGGQDPAVFFNSPQGRTFADDVMNRLEITFDNAVQSEAYNSLPTQTDGTVNRNGVISFNDLPASVREDVADLDETRLVSSLRVDGMLLGDVSGQDVTSPAQADRLTASTYRLGAFMLSTQGRPLSPTLLRQLGISEGLADRLNTVESLGLNDEAEAAARVTLRSGLSTQRSSIQNYIRTIEGVGAEAGLSWNDQTGEYEITDQEFIRSFAQSVSMNPSMMMENGVIRLSADTTRDEGWRSQLRQRIGRLDEAFSYRESLGLLDNAFNALRAEVPEDQGTAPTNYNLPEEVAADTDFINAVEATSSSLGINTNDLLRIIEFETAGSWSPSISAPTSSATGLIQFLESTAQGLGTSTEALAGMTRAEQMQYVEAYLRPYADRINNFGDLYMAVHWPAGVGQPDSFVMYREGSREYTANRGLDSNGDGTVTRGETLAVIDRRVGGTGRGAMTTPTTTQAAQVAETPAEDLLPPRRESTPAPQIDTPVLDAPVAPERMEQPVVDQPSEPAPQETEARDAIPAQEQNAEIVRSLREIAQGITRTSGEDSAVAQRAADVVTRVENGERVDMEDINRLISDALQLPPSDEKDDIVRQLYRTASQILGGQ